MSKRGFYIYWRGQDNFFESKNQRVTNQVVKRICAALMRNAEISDKTIAAAKRYIFKANYEERALSDGRKYCDITGANFSYGDMLDNYKYQHYYVID